MQNWPFFFQSIYQKKGVTCCVTNTKRKQTLVGLQQGPAAFLKISGFTYIKNDPKIVPIDRPGDGALENIFFRIYVKNPDF